MRRAPERAVPDRENCGRGAVCHHADVLDGRDFYTTLAQVLPVLLLTIVWVRAWLTSLAARHRGSGPDAVRFWTKPVVRWYTLLLIAVLLSAIAAGLLVLAGGLADAGWLRVLLLLATAMALATLMVRIGAGVLAATR